MAGRGRPNTSLTQEQLSALGINPKDMQNVTVAPPPIFPPLQSKPVPLETSSTRDYKILWKEDFLTFLKDSPYYTQSTDPENKIERYSDKYIQILTKKEKAPGDFLWNMLPNELRTNNKRKMENKNSSTAKFIRVVNVEEKLKALEKMENKRPETTTKENESGEEDNLEDLDNEDDEMDEENDYGNSYFDNGDAYNDEDDNLDDGPIY